MVQGVDTKFEEDCLQILISFCVQIEGLFFSFFFSHSLKSSYLIYLKHLFFFLFKVHSFVNRSRGLNFFLAVRETVPLRTVYLNSGWPAPLSRLVLWGGDSAVGPPWAALSVCGVCADSLCMRETPSSVSELRGRARVSDRCSSVPTREPLPTLFSMLHPLDEITPLICKSASKCVFINSFT